VKIYGRDAYDTQLLATFWRTLWYQEGGLPLGTSRIQAVEREALVTLLAGRAGVACRDVVTAGATVDGDALLVLRGEARPLATADADELDLAGCWESLALLRGARIAHRELEPTTVALVAGRPGFAEFGHATLTPTADQLMTDSAQLLATTATVVGQERAVRAAVDALGEETAGALLPYLQPPAFGGALRRALKERGLDVDELRNATAAAVGATEPQLARLRRVTWGTVVQLALLLLAVAALIRFAGNIDFEEVRTDLADASWGWIVVALAAAQLPRLSQAASTLGSIAASIRYGPVYVLQLATSYLNLALPSNVGRMAVTVRFFQRQGLPAATAVAGGAIDSVVGNVIQLVLVLTLVLFSSADLHFDLNAPSSGVLTLLWIALGLLAATILALALVRRVRRLVVGRVREWWPQVRASFATLRAPNKLVLLFGGNLATEVLFAVALGLMARGFGSHIPLAELILINSGTSLFASFIPVPGGIGVVEFGLEAGLTAAGMTPSAALATILLYRSATFYIPPSWGFFAFRWLQRNRYL
jgi:glycosyltransferase 2 family protein